MPQRTYTLYAVKQMMPISGWHALYHDDAGAHMVIPIYALALCAAHTYEIGTRQRVHTLPLASDEEAWSIHGLEYNPTDGWNVSAEANNFCGLLPPDWTLADYEADKGCGSHDTQSQETPNV